MKQKLIQVETLAVFAVSLIVIFLLMIQPIVGVADNGDFMRIMGSVGLNYTDITEVYKDKYFGYIHSQYSLQAIGMGGYVSSEIIVVWLATIIARIFSLNHVFDIRILAMIYTFIFLYAMYGLLAMNKQAAVWKNVLMAILFILVFADIGYMAYFNSLFGEPVSFTFMLLTLAMVHILLNKIKPSKWILVVFFLAAFFLVGSKVQNAPLGILLALFSLRFWHLREDHTWKRLVAAVSILLAIVSAVVYFSVPKEIKQINEYQTVFYGILKDSPSPKQDLKELGLNPDLAVNAGTNYFTAEPAIKQQAPIMREQFYPNLDHMKVALFYFKHPLRFIAKLEIAAHKGMTNRSYYLGSYEKSANRGYGAVSYAFGTWSEFKRTYMPNNLLFIALFALTYFYILISKYFRTKERKKRIYLELYMVIGIMAAISFIVPLIGDGEADLSKHLFMFNLCFDLMFVIGVLWLAFAIFDRIKK
ncbi:MAG: hypothetical protein WD469_03115 [Paenibacillaceae bacterium]